MTTAEDVLIQARKWLGVAERPDGSNNVPGITDWYGIQGAWCAMGVSRWFYDAGLPLNFSTPRGFAWTPSGIAGFQQRGQWHNGRVGIQPGDVVFYKWGNNPYNTDHVELVESVRGDGSFVAIGANVGNRVGRFVRSSCVGYGRPVFQKSPEPPDPPVVIAPPPKTQRLPRPSIPPYLRCIKLGANFKPAPGATFRSLDGSGGPEVVKLQNCLNELMPADKTVVDGKFGWGTHVLVWTWQRFAGLQTDGVVGPATWTSIDGWLKMIGR